MKVRGVPYRTIWANGDGSVGIIDQTRLPHAFETLTLKTLAEAARAIKIMQVRGAPADRRHGRIRRVPCAEGGRFRCRFGKRLRHAGGDEADGRQPQLGAARDAEGPEPGSRLPSVRRRRMPRPRKWRTRMWRRAG